MTVQFPAVRALDGVSFAVNKGEVFGIVGENGAGKSTLMKVLSGLQTPTAGSVCLDGVEHAGISSVSEATHLGIAMIHQELNLVNQLSIAANLYLGRELRHGAILDDRAMIASAEQYLSRVQGTSGTLNGSTIVGGLSIAQKQLVEIAKALSYEAQILIMDEPTAVLGEQDCEALFEIMAALKAQGVTVLYISHRLAEVERLCDRVAVLRDGALVALKNRGEFTQHDLANLMVGRELEDVFPERQTVPAAEPLLEVLDLSDHELLRNISLQIRPGEIVGLAGLVGAGRTELGECMVGLRPISDGSLKMGEEVFVPRSPKMAGEKGIVYVTEDRKEAGLFLERSSVENLTIANLRQYVAPVLKSGLEESSMKKWTEVLDIKIGNPRAPILFLSGGNQQKVCIAKWLELKPKLIILDEPTRGVDVGAKAEIYRLIHDLAAEGMACLTISSELNELLGLCHRILVMRNGEIVDEVQGETMTEERVMASASGVTAA